jgi:hypothetical protein
VRRKTTFWRLIRGAKMNIRKYMRKHESAMRETLPRIQEKEGWMALKGRHAQMIGFMQHERLIHLLVTLAFGIALLVATALALAAPSAWIYLLVGLLLVLFVPYLGHYFFLENTVQRWYRLADEIDEKRELIR